MGGIRGYDFISVWKKLIRAVLEGSKTDKFEYYILNQIIIETNEWINDVLRVLLF